MLMAEDEVQRGPLSTLDNLECPSHNVQSSGNISSKFWYSDIDERIKGILIW